MFSSFDSDQRVELITISSCKRDVYKYNRLNCWRSL